MRISIDLDNDLMAKAQMLNGNKTREETIEDTLRLLIAVESQKRLIDLWGKIEINDKTYQ